MSEWNCGCIRPLPGVPRVRIVDEEGRELFEGYYIRHENRQPAVFGGTDYLHPEDVDHLVAVDGFADWNMPRDLVIKKVTPPHRIEVIGPVPGETCELAGDGMPEGEPLSPIVDREALLALAGILRTPEQYADCGACPLRKWCDTELYNGHRITCFECKTWHTADAILEACGEQAS